MDKLLKKLLTTFSVSGNESGMSAAVKAELNNLNVNYEEDKLGNIIVKLGQGTERTMLAAHMDNIGVMATFIEDNGHIRIVPLGDFHIENYLYHTVRFANGTKGFISASKDKPSTDDLYIETGMVSREEVLKKVREGDKAVFQGNILEVKDRISAPNIATSAGCYILLKIIETVSKKAADKGLYVVFSTQHGVGGRGLRAAANNVQPETAVIIQGGEGEIGKGPAQIVMDKGFIMHEDIKNIIEQASKEAAVSLQTVVSKESSDAALMHKDGNGVKCGVISLPCNYKNTSGEMISSKDLEDVIALLNNIF